MYSDSEDEEQRPLMIDLTYCHDHSTAASPIVTPLDEEERHSITASPIVTPLDEEERHSITASQVVTPEEVHEPMDEEVSNEEAVVVAAGMHRLTRIRQLIEEAVQSGIWWQVRVGAMEIMYEALQRREAAATAAATTAVASADVIIDEEPLGGEADRAAAAIVVSDDATVASADATTVAAIDEEMDPLLSEGEEEAVWLEVIGCPPEGIYLYTRSRCNL